MLKRGQVDIADLTESIFDMLLPTEGIPIVDALADTVSHDVSDAVDTATDVARGVVRIADQIKSAAKRFMERVHVLR